MARRPAQAGAGGLALCHELSERLMAAENYLAAAQRLAEHPPARGASSSAILEKAQVQLEKASRVVGELRRDLAGARLRRSRGAAPLPESDALPAAAAPPAYRVCFLNHFARGGRSLMVCQREIVIRRAKSRDRAIEAAKKRFARLEGIHDWHIHAHTIEVELIDAAPAAAGRPGADGRLARPLNNTRRRR